ncbi:MAG: glycosyltransferase family 2 protein [Candidatus Woesearchaeota archaeon]
MKISVLVTTMNNGIERVLKELVPQLVNCEIIISHQITDKTIKPLTKIPKKVVYTYMHNKGLSKNRNNALKYATGDICVICDDDLNYVKGFNETILRAYEKNKNADIITFNAINEKGTLHSKFSKKKRVFKHTNITILSITSWMITFKRKSALKHKLFFDEKYGLGTKICVGEENIFLKDALDKQMRVIHYQKPIVIHPDESSGVDYRDELIKSRPLVFKRMFGIIGYLFALVYFPIFHRKFYKKKYSFFGFIRRSI